MRKIRFSRVVSQTVLMILRETLHNICVVQPPKDVTIKENCEDVEGLLRKLDVCHEYSRENANNSYYYRLLYAASLMVDYITN